jgi:DNA-binding transcriptional ArsR family regulator
MDAMGEWRFLSNHALVLLCIGDDPGIRLRDIAASVGITERTTHRIVDELVEGGYVSRERRGRRNRYELEGHVPLRDPLLRDRKLADFLALLGRQDGAVSLRVKDEDGAAPARKTNVKTRGN